MKLKHLLTRLGILLIVAAAGFVIWGGYLYLEVRDAAVRDEARQADAIVILGAAQYNGRPSPVLKARLDHAHDLFRKGFAPAIITTGGFGPDLRFSEAHVSTKYLVELGVDAGLITTEQGGSTTQDSIEAAARLMLAKRWTRAVVVSDGFHLYRLKRIFADHQIEAFTSPAPSSPIEVGATYRLWYSLREVFLLSAYRLFG